MIETIYVSETFCRSHIHMILRHTIVINNNSNMPYFIFTEPLLGEDHLKVLFECDDGSFRSGPISLTGEDH